LTPFIDFFYLVERIGGYDWRRIQYLTGKGRKPFTEFKRHYISTQFNFKFYDQRYVSVSHVSTVEVELYEGKICTLIVHKLLTYQLSLNLDTIRDLNVAINAAGNVFYNCSLLCKWNNIQIFDCSHLSTTNKLVEDIEIKAVGETSLKQVNAAIQPGNFQYNVQVISTQ
jgi:hypothetical protein